MRDLIEYLPPHLAADPEVAAIMEAMTVVLRKFEACRDDVFLQFQPQTATWGLDMWEAAYAADSGPDLPTERRREIVLAKIRSARTATVEAIRNLAASFTDGQVTVEEHNGEYYFTLVVQGFAQTPEWSDAFKRAISDFAPAHLESHLDLLVMGEDAVEYAFAACVGWYLEDSAATMQMQ